MSRLIRRLRPLRPRRRVTPLAAALALLAPLLPAAALAIAAPDAALAFSGPAQQQAYVINSNVTGQQVSLQALSAANPATEVYNAGPFAGSQTDGIGQDVVISPDGSTAYVGVMNDGSGIPNAVDIVNAVSGQSLGTIDTDGNVGYLALSPNGTTLYITGAQGIDLYDTVTHSLVTDDIPSPNQDFLNGIAVSPDGSTLYAADFSSGQILVINPATRAITARIAVGNEPSGVLLSPDGSRLYVANTQDGTVSVINTSAGTVTATVPVGQAPGNPCISADGSTLYVPNSQASTVSIISAATDTVTGTIAKPVNVDLATGCAVSPDGSQVWVTYASGGVVAFSTTGAHQVVGENTSTLASPQGITFGPDPAPVAALQVTPATAGQLTELDASGSTATYGTITSYAWNFGDGSTLTTTQPTVTHDYASPGPFTASVTVTDSAGTSTTQVYDGLQVLRNGGSQAETTASFTITPAAATLEGTLTASDGSPLAGATVTLLAPDGSQIDSTTTDGNGNFGLSGTSEQNVTIDVSGSNLGPAVPAQFDLTSQFNFAGTTFQTITLPPLVSVTANVTDTTGHPLAGVAVSQAGLNPVVPVALFPGATAGTGGNTAAPATTDSSGNATLSMFPTPQAQVFASIDSRQTFAIANATSDTNVSLQLPTLPSVNVTSSANPSNLKQSVTFTASVGANGSGGPVPTGTVTFTVDGTAQAPVTLSPSGQATATLSTLAVGTHTVTAAYSGDGTYAGVTSATLNQAVLPNATTTTLASTAMPSVTGQAGSVTATVAAPSGQAKPTGSVTFTVDGTQLPAVTISGGKASIKLASLAVGTHSISAIYSGDANDASSTSAALTQVVNQAATSAGLTSTATPSVYGQNGSLTAAVSVNSPGTGNPTGTVTFTVDGAPGTPVALSAAGKATLPLAGLGAGTHQVTATYSGDANYLGATSATFTQTVNQASTTTALKSSKNPVTDGGAGTLTATVKDVAPAAGSPTGTITFTVDGVAQAPVSLTVAGLAEMLLSSLSPGTHTITAAYSGDANHAASTSAALTQVVTGGPMVRTLTGFGAPLLMRP